MQDSPRLRGAHWFSQFFGHTARLRGHGSVTHLILAVVLGLGGTIAAALFTFVIGLAGAPGALLGAAAARRRSDARIPPWAIVLTAFGHLVASMLWIAALYQSVHALLGNGSGSTRFIVWIVAVFIANAPIAIARKDAAQEPNKNAQHFATTVASPLVFIASVVLLFAPSILAKGFAWVPHYSVEARLAQAKAGLPDGYVPDRDSLSAAFRYFDIANELTQVPAGQTTMASTPEHDAKVQDALVRGLSAGRSVRGDFLHWLHPQMREFFESRYIAGQALYLEGLRAPNKTVHIAV